MQFVQIVITDEQATKAKYAIDALLDDPERFVMEDEERKDFERLSVFLTTVAQNPRAFPPTGKMAVKVRGIVRAAKGDRETPSRKNKRKARQERRIRTAKERRKNRREDAANFNAARERVEADMKEAEELQRELEEKLANEPKFDVVNIHGETVIAGVPASMVRAADGEPGEGETAIHPQVILPGSAEALGIETP